MRAHYRNVLQVSRRVTAVPSSASLPLTPYDRGCTPGTGADQATNFQTALTDATALGVPLDLAGQLWRIDSSITVPSGAQIQNGTIDFSAAASGDTLFECIGTLGSSTAFTAISSHNAASFVVSSATGLAVKDWLYLSASNPFGGGGTTNGEFVKIEAIASTTITPYSRVYDTYTTTPLFYKPTLKEYVRFRNLRLIGGGAADDQYGIRVELCRDVIIRDCEIEHFGQAGIQVVRSIDVRVSNCSLHHGDDATGNSYGVVIANGCLRVNVVNCEMTDWRHGVSIGGTDGVDYHCKVANCIITGCTDTALDTHAQARFTSFIGNTLDGFGTRLVEGGGSGGDTGGITIQSADTIVSGNIITGFTSVGIFAQLFGKRSSLATDTLVITGNSICAAYHGTLGTVPAVTYGVYIENQKTVVGLRFVVAGNQISVGDADPSVGIYINNDATNGATMYNSVISGNNVNARRQCIQLVLPANKFMRGLTIVGNTLETSVTTTYDCIDISSIATANFFEKCLIVGNNTTAGRYSLNVSANVSRVKADANMFLDFGTAYLNGTIVGTNTTAGNSDNLAI